MLVLKRTIFALLCALAILLPCAPRAYAAGADNAAQAAIVVHPETGTVLYEKNADARLGIASTTKIMTALVVLEHCALGEPVEILPEYTAVEGSSMYLRAGETYTVEELLYGMMLVSGNDAAVALACHTAGSVQAFADMNHNRLLRSYDGAIGVKTGYTKASGRTLVSCAQRGATRFVCVTLSDPDDWNDHTRLLDWAFENYAYRAVAGDTPVYAVPVLSGTVQVCAVTPEREAYLLLRPEDTVTLTAELPRFAFAPVQQGTRAGTLTATGPDGQSVSVALCYAKPAALDPDVKITPFARLGRLWTRVSRYFSAYYPEF